MSNEKFEMSEDLLRSVILKQAGTVLKAIQECIQNSLDAQATIIKLDINNRGFSFYDNGCGMDKKQIDSFFKIFGNSSKKDDDNKIGAFGMGRGQVFSFGYTVWKTKQWKISVNIMKRLGYKIREIKTNIKGTDICCAFFKPIDNWGCDSIINKVRNYFIPDDNIKFYINGYLYNPQMVNLSEYGDDDFTVFSSNRFSSSIFSQNLYVTSISSMFDYNINCNKKMELNFARNSFLDSEESSKKLKTLLNKIEEKELLKIKKFDATGGKHVLELLDEGKIDIKRFENKKVIELANGKLVSIKQLEGKTIMFGKKNRMSDMAIQQGYTVVNAMVAHLITSLKMSNKINLILSDKRPEDVVDEPKHKTVDVLELFKRIGYRSLLYYFYTKELNNRVFGGKRKILVGVSDSSGAWTDGKNYICMNLSIFNKKMIRREKDMEIYHTLLHEYAHDDDDTNETNHDGNFYERYYDLVEGTKNRFGRFIHNYGIKEVERDYEYLIDDLKEEMENNKNNKIEE